MPSIVQELKEFIENKGGDSSEVTTIAEAIDVLDGLIGGESDDGSNDTLVVSILLDEVDTENQAIYGSIDETVSSATWAQLIEAHANHRDIIFYVQNSSMQGPGFKTENVYRDYVAEYHQEGDGMALNKFFMYGQPVIIDATEGDGHTYVFPMISVFNGGDGQIRAKGEDVTTAIS